MREADWHGMVGPEPGKNILAMENGLRGQGGGRQTSEDLLLPSLVRRFGAMVQMVETEKSEWIQQRIWK